MRPASLSCLVINGFDDAFTPDAVVGTGPPVDSIGRLGEINTPTRVRIDDKQPVLAVEAWGAIVRHTSFIGRDQAPIRRRFFLGVGYWSPLAVNSQCPIHRAIRSRQETLSICPVEHKEVSVAGALHEHLFLLAVKDSIDQNRSLYRIPVVRIVGRYLKCP